ncbi:MAG TPA: AraC family transcriptional regulator [Arenimonas sp.]|uniref:helix-turn-helix domain-containing protein n=1 Tax=Arenimonas sp. TaxID=1872635 RepID=UPI002BF894A7|nr:AraC family transcriptional regulator [Arenimonas sp.]HMB57503.1 AraC family transcriptional regulator [Arenimonas sp.]
MTSTDVVAETRKRALAGVGRVIVWSGGSIWVGRHVGQVPEHAHHAIQVSLALEGRFRARAQSWPESRACAGLIVMPDQAHCLDGCDTAVATLFIEPNSIPGAALRQRFAGWDVALLSDEEAEACAAGLRSEYLSGATDARLVQFARAAICRIAGDPLTAPRPDPRITAALEWMRQHLATAMRLQDVAAAVHLSPGRFRHLFVAQTGTSFRAWLLWARAEHAIAAATCGMSWTEASHAAGFADAAHFTRTCRRVFGIAPTMLVFEKESS